jgi:hypothetical protein
MKYILFFCIIYSQITFAQKTSDILRFGHTFPFATARSSGLGNAMGAVGGDMNSMNINPAGLALFRKSEFLLSYHLSALSVIYLQEIGLILSNKNANCPMASQVLV